MFILKGGTKSLASPASEESQPTEKSELAVAEDRAASQVEAPRKFGALRDIFLDFGPLIAGVFAGVALGALYLSGR